ncbi:discoidin domain-containing protein [Shewanella sp. JM162201]|uniref:Discoidin domain-containing protein n=1 Tax=Shewanella jiangmenensis TaxID=2837387 RepID=A0ABS5V1R6_9GAMM|nr:basic secretory protein-like protein [Shewanella jiangmenensis]MBT1444414.1 discoidin domain-containing protein [Shewanella jiangmenensis]
MKTLTLSLLALTVGAALVGCNDGSGFHSTQDPSPVAGNAPGNGAGNTQGTSRNMSSDKGAQISAPGANSPAAEDISKLIDGDTGSKFLTFSPEATIVFKGVKPYVLTSYNLVSANDAPPRDPKTWTLEGSNDGDNWTEIDSRSDQTFSARGKRNSYSLDKAPAAYQYFRFNMVHGGTDQWGGNILQLAELELMVTAEEPIVSFKATNTTPAIGEFVIFHDTSLVNPSKWQWQFEGGNPATSTEQNPLVRFDSLGAKTVTLKASNDKGESELVQEGFIRVWDPNEPWAGFHNPSVSFIKHKPEHPGQKALERVMPDLEAVIHEVSLGVAKVLYHNVTQSKVFNSVTFETDEYEFPAAKSGTDKDMVLMFDLNHIGNLESQGDEALRREILGVLWHELTHGYNHAPQNGQYQPGDEKHTFLEALANYVRIQAGYLEQYRGKVAYIENWNEDAYNQTSFFLEWVANTNRSSDFIRRFNQSAKDIEKWSFDAAFKSIFGEDRGIDVVFKEYQQYLIKDLGLTPNYPTPVAGYRNFAIDAGVSASTTATHIGIWGEGPDKLIDNNIKNKFNAVIETPWWLTQYAPELTPINQVSSVDVLISTPSPVVLNKYSLTTGNDNELRDPTSWTVSASNDGEHWQALGEGYYPPNPPRLTTFHFDVAGNTTAYKHYRFEFDNARSDAGVGGDNGRLVQIGELALLTRN